MSDGAGGGASDTVVITYPQPSSTPPQVSFVAPTTAEQVTAGTPYTIRWQASDDDGVREFSLTFKGSDGRYVDPCTPSRLPGNVRECTWTNPGPVGEGTLSINACASHRCRTWTCGPKPA